MPSLAVRIAFALLVVSRVVIGQAPLLQYPFNEGGSPAATENIGSFMPGPSPLVGQTLTGVGLNGTFCLTGVGGVTNEVATPYNIALGNGSWTLGFGIRNAVAGGFQYVCGEIVTGGWRVFTNGGAGAGNIRMAGTAPFPNVDIPGGAGDSDWVHVVWVHDAPSAEIRGYLNGVLAVTVAAPVLGLSSGTQFRIGRSITSLLAGTLIEDFRLYDRELSPAEIDAWAANCADAGQADFTTPMITEVSWGDPDGIEVTNFETVPVDLTNWVVKWQTSSTTTVVSAPINVVMAPGQSVVIVESTSGLEPVPLASPTLDLFPTISLASGASTVALIDDLGNVVDEVRVASTTGAHPGWTFGGTFRGLATRGAISGTAGQVGVERIWGLDSNGGTDWTEQPNRSFGRQNRSSGPRGTDPIPNGPAVVINEYFWFGGVTGVGASPLVELKNLSGSEAADLARWQIRLARQGGPDITLTNPAVGTVNGALILPGAVAVFGQCSQPPCIAIDEVPFFTFDLVPPSAIEIAVYDNLGRLIDLVRTTQLQGTDVYPYNPEPSLVVFNQPRAPSHWSDWVGGALLVPGAETFGRHDFFAGTDHDSGVDFRCFAQESLGAPNVAADEMGPSGSVGFDVRLGETAAGNGFEAIINAGASRAGWIYNILIQTTHGTGFGPVYGLSFEAILNFPIFYHTPPFSGALDGQGSGRIDFNPGSLPPGIDADIVFFLEEPAGPGMVFTLVLPFDT